MSQACNFIKKETLAQVFSSEFYNIFKNTIFKENLWTTASVTFSFSVGDLCFLCKDLLNFHLACFTIQIAQGENSTPSHEYFPKIDLEGQYEMHSQDQPLLRLSSYCFWQQLLLRVPFNM